jgi:uncharacterized protein (UPF0335 family)
VTEQIADADVSGQRIKSYIERVERLQEQRDDFAEDISDVFAEAKGFGFSVPTLRAVIRLRKLDPDKRAAADALLDMYRSAIGMG